MIRCADCRNSVKKKIINIFICGTIFEALSVGKRNQHCTIIDFFLFYFKYLNPFVGEQ